MIDRDQVRREAEGFIEYARAVRSARPSTKFAEKCIALIYELEQTEDRLDSANYRLASVLAELKQAEQRVEGLTEFLTDERYRRMDAERTLGQSEAP